MQRVFEWQLCSYPETDSHRFADVIESAISTGTSEKRLASSRWLSAQRRAVHAHQPVRAVPGKVKKFKGFSKWASKVRSKPPPKNPLKPIRPRHQGASQDLVAMIRGKVSTQRLQRICFFLLAASFQSCQVSVPCAA